MNQIQGIQKKEAKQVFWNYLSVFTGRVGSTILSGIILAIIARKLMPDGYGRFSLFLLVANFITVIFLNWPNSAVVRYGKEMCVARGNIGEVLGSVLAILSLTFSLSLVMTVVFRNKVNSYIGNDFFMFCLLIIFVASSAFYDLSFYVLQSVGKIKVYGFLSTLEKAVAIVLLFAFLKIKALSVKDAIIIYTVGQLAVVLMAFFSVEKKYILPLRVTVEQIRRIIGYAWPMLIGAVSSFITGWIDIVFIKKYFQVADVGVYSLAYRGMTFFLMLAMSTISLTVPMIISFRTLHQPNLVKMYVDELIPQGVFFFGIFFSFVISISDPFVTLIFGDPYKGAIIPFVILLAGVGFNAIGCFYTGFTAAYDIVFKVVLVTVLMSIIKLVGMFFLVSRYGLIGAALATFIAMAFCNLLYITITNASGYVGKSNMRYLASIWATLPLFGLIGHIFHLNLFLKFILFVIGAALYIVFAKKIDLFKSKTLDLIDYIEMPDLLKKNIKKVYSAFL